VINKIGERGKKNETRFESINLFVLFLFFIEDENPVGRDVILVRTRQCASVKVLSTHYDKRISRCYIYLLAELFVTSAFPAELGDKQIIIFPAPLFSAAMRESGGIVGQIRLCFYIADAEITSSLLRFAPRLAPRFLSPSLKTLFAKIRLIIRIVVGREVREVYVVEGGIPELVGLHADDEGNRSVLCDPPRP
jgi:hypothetical protein